MTDYCSTSDGMGNNVREIYEARLASLEKERRRLSARSGMTVPGKVLTFAAAVVFLYLSVRTHSVTDILLTALSVLLYVILCLVDRSLCGRISELQKQAEACRKEISFLDGDYSPFPDGSRYISKGHEYSSDLDIFGPDSLFNRINRTVTDGGSDALARRLTVLSSDRKEIEENADAVEELARSMEWRMEFISTPHVDSDLGELARMMAGKETPDRVFGNILPFVPASVAMCVLILCMADVLPWAACSAMVILYLMLSMLVSRRFMASNVSLEKLHRGLSLYQELIRKTGEKEFRSVRLKTLQDSLFRGRYDSREAFRKLSLILNMSDIRSNALMYFLLNGTVMADLLLIWSFRRWSRRYLVHIGEWLDSVAELEALASLGTYAFNSPACTRAVLLDGGEEDVIRARGICHPFLYGDKAVRNDFTLRKSETAIVTGANMAGKSTFLRTIGISYVLAANGAPVFAESFGFCPVSLFSSMRTTDSLSEDISYFNAELLRLKQLLLHVRSHAFTLVILDEILKGTNSEDKLRGSEIFLKELSRYNVSVMVATHDLQLTALEEEAPETYTNYRFEIGLSEEITYSYRVERGVAHNLNASYLLTRMLEDLKN